MRFARTVAIIACLSSLAPLPGSAQDLDPFGAASAFDELRAPTEKDDLDAVQSTIFDGSEPRFQSPPRTNVLGCATPCTVGTLSALHPYYDVYLSCVDGAFTARTGTAHPVTAAAGGAPQNVIFGGAGGGPGTSDISFFFHEVGVTLRDPTGGGVCAFDPPDTVAEPNNIGLESEWSTTVVAGLNVVMREEIVAFGTNVLNSGIRLTLGVKNLSSSTQPTTVGLRWQIDYQNASDDGPRFATITCDPPVVGPERATEHELLPAEIQAFFRIRNDTGTPIFSNNSSTTTLAGFPGTGTPDRLVYGRWPTMSGSVWNYITTEGANADSDSAVLYYYGYRQPDGVLLQPGEAFSRSFVIFTTNVSADCGGFIPTCATSIVSPPTDRSICVGDTTPLDATGVSLTDCGGTTLYTWTDDIGTIATTAAVDVSPTVTTDYTVRVECEFDPDCFTEIPVRVTVEAPPAFAAPTATDLSACNVGTWVNWPDATFTGATGTGVYNVYRSPVSCADALLQPPHATGLTLNDYYDAWTDPGGAFWYVLEAEDDDLTVGPCLPRGAHHGGVATRTCLPAAVTDESWGSTPYEVFDVLRVSHVGDDVTVSWPTARPLLADEHLHLLKAWWHPLDVWVTVNGEDDRSPSFTENDPLAPLQCFDLRVANACEELSTDEYPPGL